MEKISKASTHWLKEYMGGTYNANKLCCECLTTQRINMIDKVVPEKFQKALAKTKRENKKLNGSIGPSKQDSRSHVHNLLM